jgi:tRNA A37 threonylcarbamoyladenosine dehydratase
MCRSTADIAAERASTTALAQYDDDWLQRSRLLVGDSGLARLQAANVLVVGLGGVGGFCAEFLCRAGVGAMTIVDGDEVDPTNRNRQLLALRSTQAMPKSRVLAERLLDINPDLKLTEVQVICALERVQRI